MVYITKEGVERYIKAYVETYMEYVKKRKSEIVKLPHFCKGYPFHITAYIMPNEAVFYLFKYNTTIMKIDIKELKKYDELKAIIKRKEHNHMIAIPPVKKLTEDAAMDDAMFDLSIELRKATYKSGLEAARNSINDTIRQVDEIIKTNPWLEKQFTDLKKSLEGVKEPLHELYDEYEKLETDGKYTTYIQIVSTYQKIKLDRTKTITPKDFEKFLRAYIDGYRESIPSSKKEKPAFYDGYPYMVKGFILPNNATVALFKMHNPTLKIDVKTAKKRDIISEVNKKEHHRLICFPPLTPMRKDDAIYFAKLSVKDDLINAYFRVLIENAKKSIGKQETQIDDIIKTNPWLDKPLNQISSKLVSIKQLFDVLGEELKKTEIGRRYKEHLQMIDTLSKYKSPVVIPREESAEPPVTAAVAAAEPVIVAATPHQVVDVSAQPQTVVEHISPEPKTVHYELRPEEKQTLDMIKATLYNIDVKMDDFERRLNYMDKYMESVQKQQADKFTTQNEIMRYEVRRSKYASIGISIVALILSIILFIAEYERIVEVFSRIFGG